MNDLIKKSSITSFSSISLSFWVNKLSTPYPWILFLDWVEFKKLPKLADLILKIIKLHKLCISDNVSLEFI